LSVAKGEFILIDYTTRIRETGDLFDTTSGEEAKKGNIFKEGSRYEPMLVVVGEGWVLRGLDDALVGLEVDKPTTIEIPPENAFGARDPTKVRMIPLSRFRRQNISPYPGAQIDIDGRQATVRSVGAGRVQVDFNPPLAGKTLVYDTTVRRIITEREDKLRALAHRRVPNVDLDKFKITVVDKEVDIEVPEEAFYLEGIQAAKRGLASDIEKYVSEAEKVVFTEVFQKKKEEEAIAPAAAPSSPQPAPADASEGTQAAP
jgi:peptidylprolyl isomerase